MNTHERIIALLNGDLKDDSDVADLLHILSVSDEKRRMLLNQLHMSRMLNASARTITPSHAADAKLWQSIAAEKASALAPLPLEQRDARWGRFFSLPVALLLLMVVGMSAMMGYWLRPALEPAVANRAESAASHMPDRAFSGAIDSLHGLLSTARASLALLRTQSGTGSTGVTAIHSQDRPGAVAEPSMARDIQVAEPISARDSASGPMLETIALRDAPMLPPSATVSSSTAGPLPPEEIEQATDGTRWKVGLRKYLRTSFPQVQNLMIQQPPTSDQELRVSYGLSGAGRSDIELGLGAGQMTFAQKFHTTPASGTRDTIVEQSPSLIYGRAFIESHLLTMGSFNSALELGGGATSAGPLGMVGVNLEYRPIDLFALEIGASGWVLATQFRGSTYTSFNVNAHWGLTIGF